jgi:ABC-2 type transport system permease protein
VNTLAETVAVAPVQERRRARGGEAAKFLAFLRRDFLIAWSYRTAFVSDLVGLGFALLSFYFVGLMVDPDVIPEYGGERATYMEFVAIGLLFGVFVSIGLGRVATALRTEQLTGTLESVLVTPTSPAVIQFGSVLYELLYMPLRTALFFALIAVAFGVHVEPGGIPAAALVFVAFLPFVWGLGVFSAAAALTVRRGAGGVGLAVAAMTLFSGAYFPAHLLPGWLESTVAFNPIGITLEGMRDSLLGGDRIADVWQDAAILLPISAASLAAGAVAFKLALRRERRSGTLGLY